MADIDLTLAVRNQELARGLAEAEARIALSARRMEQAATAGTQATQDHLTGRARTAEQRMISLRTLQTSAFLGFGAAIRMTQKLMQDYAKHSNYAADVTGQFDHALDGLARTLQRGVAPGVAAATELMVNLRRAAQDPFVEAAMASLVPGFAMSRAVQSQDLIQAMRVEEEATRSGRNRLEAGAAVGSAARQFELESANTPLERARARLAIAEQSAREEARKAITGSDLQGDQARASFVMLRTEALRQEVRLLETRNRLEQEQNERESRRAINDRLNKNLGERIEKRDRDQAASRALRLEEQMTKAQELRIRGRDREADKLEVIAQFEKRIRDVADTDFSSPAEADRYRGRLRMLMGDQLRMLGMAAPDRTASIGSGGYSSGIGRVAFGNGLGPGAAGSSPEAELKRANQTIKLILQHLERDAKTAIFN